MTPLGFAEVLMAWCYHFRGSVSSWGRTPERNRTVGGVPLSAHQLWLAADVVYAPLPAPPVVVATAMAERLGVKLIREDDHDHLQAAGWRAG